jgi:hypothetical protein
LVNRGHGSIGAPSEVFGKAAVRRLFKRLRIAGIIAASTLGGNAVAAPAPAIQTPTESLAQDAEQYAARYSVPLDEAVRRLRAQEDSAAVTDRIATALGPRLAGISIEHAPQHRAVVLLTGTEPVADQAALAAGSPVPVVFQLGAAATRAQVVAAMRTHQGTLRAELPNARGMGLDPRTGELVLLVRAVDADRIGLSAIEERAEALTGVPVRVAIADPAKNLVRGGSRIVGVNPADGRRYACTTGFVVSNGARTGVVTAAHCPDAVTYQEEGDLKVPLAFVGQWGARHQDVQVHESTRAAEPLFYADRRGGALRTVTGARSRQSTRAGDAVCHWGESSGYSCSEVELTDYAPPGDLCGGPCEPVWVTVKGPNCRSGDSGGPVFSGTTAYGILKGGSGITGRCNFYYYMSTDFLPDGWSLVKAPEEVSSGVARGTRLR